MFPSPLIDWSSTTRQDDDNYAIDRQLKRAKAKWARVGKILSVQATAPRVSGYFYKAILQAVLLYGLVSWVISVIELKQLHSIHHRVTRYIRGRHIKQLVDSTYEKYYYTARYHGLSAKLN